MPHAGLIALAIAGLVALLVGVKYLVRWIGFPCQFCMKKVIQFTQLPQADQASILRYFREHEGRDPDRSGLFVCTHCRTVHDDFSGELASRDVDRYGCRTFCKVCGRLLTGCEPDAGMVACRHCGTPYEWRTDEASGYRFFMPPRDAVVLETPPPYADS